MAILRVTAVEVPTSLAMGESSTDQGYDTNALLTCPSNSAGDSNTFKGNGINFVKRQTDVLSQLLSPLNSDLDSNSAKDVGNSNGDGNAAGNGMFLPLDVPYRAPTNLVS